MTRPIALLLACLGLVGATFALQRAGTIQLNAPDPERYRWLGIDVSHHQGAIDWPAVAASGVAFAYIKSTEGRDFRDRRFEENWTGARDAGIPRGAYHFFTFCSPGAAQAAHFLEVVPPEAEALTPVVDVEFVGNCEGHGELADVRRELERFVEAVEQAWQRPILLYATPDALDRVVGDALPGRPIWIRSVFREPAPDAHRGWLVWQFSDTARIPGIAGPVDRDALRPGATLEALGGP